MLLKKTIDALSYAIINTYKKWHYYHVKYVLIFKSKLRIND